MGRFIDLQGQVFGELTVIQRKGSSNDGQAIWECVCSCGKTSYVDGKSLRTGNTKTCGCSRKNLRPSRVKHGEIGTRLYRIWSNMKHRCYGETDVEKYKRYGGRGISVCNEWHEYTNFRDWAINNGYSDELTIDRIDNNRGYSPDNCRWLTHKEQCMNRGSNHYVSDGKETLSVLQWAKKLGVSHSVIIQRIKKGETVHGKNDTLEAFN